MLCLTRKPGEAVHIGDDVVVRVLSVSPSGHVKLGIDAPREIPVHRDEVAQAIADENRRSAADAKPTHLLDR